MNIFYVDSNPNAAARALPDKLIVKMPLETAQLLSTAVRIHNANCDDDPNLYKITHKNHPSAIWARTNKSNFHWLVQHGLALCYEYYRTYGKIHKCETIIEYCLRVWINSIPEGKFYPPPQCMPEKYKSDNAIESYRQYMINEKDYYAKWKNREKPSWWKKSE